MTETQPGPVVTVGIKTEPGTNTVAADLTASLVHRGHPAVVRTVMPHHLIEGATVPGRGIIMSWTQNQFGRVVVLEGRHAISSLELMYKYRPMAAPLVSIDLDEHPADLAALNATVSASCPHLGNGGVILVGGPPGSGKGTHAERLAEALGGVAISSGDVFRKLDAAGRFGGDSELMRSGQLVTSERFMTVMTEIIRRVPADQVIVLDGLARKQQEADPLLDFLASIGRRLSVLIRLDIDEATMRLRTQRGRPDDDPAVQAVRLASYREDTVPSLGILSSRAGVTIDVDSTPAKDLVWASIKDQLAANSLPLP